MNRNWKCGVAIIAFLSVAAIGLGQDSEMVFSRVSDGGDRKGSGDYEIVDRVSLTTAETGFLEAVDYSIAPLEAYRAESPSTVDLWMYF